MRKEEEFIKWNSNSFPEGQPNGNGQHTGLVN